MISQGKTIVKSKDCTLPVDWPAKNVDTAWGTASQPAFDAGSNNFKILINEFLRNNEETVPYTPYTKLFKPTVHTVQQLFKS